MKVVLRSDVEGIGKRGDIAEIADGFARNYLIPSGRAIRATPGVSSQATAMRRARDRRDARDREGAEAIARQLVATVVRVPARAGTEGRLFGSVTSVDLVAATQSQTGVELDRRRVALEEPLKSLGTHQVPVKLHPEVEFQLTVEVVADR